MSRPWRFRECPRCGAEFAAGELAYAGTYRPGWGYGPEARRICPRCGHRAPTSAFPVSRDMRTGFVRDGPEWQAEYVRVLASPAWRALRLAVAQAQEYRCARCGRFGGLTRPTLELHHRHYRSLGHEGAADVVALCKVCHAEADIERAAEGQPRSSPATHGGSGAADAAVAAEPGYLELPLGLPEARWPGRADPDLAGAPGPARRGRRATRGTSDIRGSGR